MNITSDKQTLILANKSPTLVRARLPRIDTIVVPAANTDDTALTAETAASNTASVPSVSTGSITTRYSRVTQLTATLIAAAKPRVAGPAKLYSDVQAGYPTFATAPLLDTYA